MSLLPLPEILIRFRGAGRCLWSQTRRDSGFAIVPVGSLLVGLGDSFPLLVASRFISGIGALTIAIVAPKQYPAGLQTEIWGRSFNTAMPVGTILTLNVFGCLAVIWNWRVPIILTAVYSLFILLLFFFIREVDFYEILLGYHFGTGYEKILGFLSKHS
jgi:hypothetical protein